MLPRLEPPTWGNGSELDSDSRLTNAMRCINGDKYNFYSLTFNPLINWLLIKICFIREDFTKQKKVLLYSFYVFVYHKYTTTLN